ncbi:MAG: rhodanese-like domain-containing protein [Candidatus Glassbacteria bacterium]
MKNFVYTEYVKKPVLLLLVSLVMGILTNLDFVGAALRGEKKLTIDEKVEEVSSSLPQVTLDEALDAYIKGEVVFIDARDEGSFEFGHIPGAINVPWEDVQNESSRILELVPTGMPLITYCDGSDCQSSILLAGELVKLGLDDVKVFFGGWVEWEEAQYPIEEGLYE